MLLTAKKFLLGVVAIQHGSFKGTLLLRESYFSGLNIGYSSGQVL